MTLTLLRCNKEKGCDRRCLRSKTIAQVLPSYTIINMASRSSRGQRKVFIFIDTVNNNDLCIYICLSAWRFSCFHVFIENRQWQPMNTLSTGRVAELDSLSSGAKMAMKIFVERVFTIFATNALFLRIIANLQT